MESGTGEAGRGIGASMLNENKKVYVKKEIIVLKSLSSYALF